MIVVPVGNRNLFPIFWVHMYKFSSNSIEKLNTCDKRLQDLLYEVIKYIDVTVIEGYRSSEDQLKAFSDGKSEAMPGKSKHNIIPSMAVDVAPYPINWKDKNRFYYLGGLIKGIAYKMNIPIRWGGDWNGDNDFDGQKLIDLVHFELM